MLYNKIVFINNIVCMPHACELLPSCFLCFVRLAIFFNVFNYAFVHVTLFFLCHHRGSVPTDGPGPTTPNTTHIICTFIFFFFSLRIQTHALYSYIRVRIHVNKMSTHSPIRIIFLEGRRLVVLYVPVIIVFTFNKYHRTKPT